MTSSNNLYKKIAGLALATAAILVIPLVLTLLNPTAHMNGGEGGGFDWTPFDFVFMGALIFGTGLTYILVTRRADKIAYRAAVGIALGACFLLIWVNGAVGIIGSENNDFNLWYAGVIAVGLIGALISRLKAERLSFTLFAMALAQALIAIYALLTGEQHALTGVYHSSTIRSVIQIIGVNGFFIVLFVLSGLFFRYADREQETSERMPEQEAGL